MFAVRSVVNCLLVAVSATFMIQLASSDANVTTYTCYICKYVYETEYCDDDIFHEGGVPTKDNCACCTMQYSTSYDATLKKAVLSGSRDCYSADKADSVYRCKTQRDVFTCQGNLCNRVASLAYSSGTILLSFATALCLHLFVVRRTFTNVATLG